MKKPAPNRRGLKVSHLINVAIGLTGLTGVLAVAGIFLGSEAALRFVEIPFWLTVGSFAAALNYLPISKGKPGFFPLLGIFSVAFTSIWLCVDGYILNAESGDEILNRVRITLILMLSCYVFTHFSLLLLAYKPMGPNKLLVFAGASIMASGLVYFGLLAGLVTEETFLFAICLALVLFFIKFSLTVGLIFNHVRKKENWNDSYPN